MAGRREYKTGSAYQRASDWRWLGTVDVGWTAKGTRRRVTVTNRGCHGGCPPRCPHRTQIKRKLDAKKRQVDQDGLAPTSTRATVKTWAEQWLPREERRLRPNSYGATRTAVTKWIVPTIGHKRLETLTPADIRSVADAHRKAGVSTSSALRTHSVLMVMLKAAIAEGYTVPQRILFADKPAKAVNDRTDLGIDNAVKVLEQAAALPHGSRWVAALLQGIRQGEALGLTWDQVDLAAETLTISWQLQALRYNEARQPASGFRIPDGYEARQLKGALHLVRPKSTAGWRVVPLVEWMTAALTSWREVAPKSPHGLVWPNTDGSPRYYKADDAEWYALQDAAGVHHPTRVAKDGSLAPFTMHEARHTTATLLLEAKVDPAIITAIMGHSSIVTSRGYMHASQTVAREALSGVARRLQLSREGNAAGTSRPPQ